MIVTCISMYLGPGSGGTGSFKKFFDYGKVRLHCAFVACDVLVPASDRHPGLLEGTNKLHAGPKSTKTPCTLKQADDGTSVQAHKSVPQKNNYTTLPRPLGAAAHRPLCKCLTGRTSRPGIVKIKIPSNCRLFGKETDKYN